jgi:hypothetical protein
MQSKIKLIYGNVLGLRGKVPISGASRGGFLKPLLLESVNTIQQSGIQMLEMPPLQLGGFGSEKHNNDD